MPMRKRKKNVHEKHQDNLISQTIAVPRSKILEAIDTFSADLITRAAEMLVYTMLGKYEFLGFEPYPPHKCRRPENQIHRNIFISNTKSKSGLISHHEQHPSSPTTHGRKNLRGKTK